MPDYSKSKIYKIVCNITGLVYIGSTSQTLSKRIQDHKKNYQKYLNEKYHYITSFKIIENDNYDIVLLEDFPCERKEQLHAGERYFIENTECVNKQIPTRTMKEYYQDNKEQIQEKKKKFREDNKEKIREQNKQYYYQNKEKLREQKKHYRQENKELMKERNHQNYLKNKGKKINIKPLESEYLLGTPGF